MLPRLRHPGRLVEVRSASNNAWVASYGWDPFDRRDRRTVTGGVDERHDFASRDPIAIHELSGSDFRRANLVHGESGVGPAVALVRDEHDADGDRDTAETIQVLCGQNYAGSLVFSTDAAGAELEGNTYDDFGFVSTWSPGGTPRANALLALPGRFQGMAYDPETALHRAGPRHYEAATGRWLQMDPLGTWGDPVGLGAESHALGHSPTIFSDPSGRIVAAVDGAGDDNSEPIYSMGDKIADGLQKGDTAFKDDVNRDSKGRSTSALSPQPAAVADRVAAEVQRRLKVDKCQTVILIGHSHGGAAVVEVAKKLKELGICVDLLIAVDAVGGSKAVFGPFVSDMQVPDSVTRVVNLEATGGFFLDSSNVVRAAGGGYTPAVGGRVRSENLPSCINPSSVRAPGEGNTVVDAGVNHGNAPNGAGARKIVEATIRHWAENQRQGKTANCCGACRK